MQAQMVAFLEALNDAVVLVDKAGVVRHHNARAVSLLHTELNQEFPHPLVIKAVADVAAGYGGRPVEIGTEGQDSLSARVLALPNPGVYAVVIHDEGAHHFYEMTMRNFYELLRTDLAGPIHRFVQSMPVLEGAGAEVSEQMRTAGKAIVAQLERIEILAELFGKAPLVDSQRLSWEKMIEDALNAEGKALEQRKIEVYLHGMKEELPPVYGSPAWLTRALRELINNAARHATPGSKLEIAFRCTGTHVILSLRNHGQFASVNLRGGRLFVPFNQATQYVAEHQRGAKARAGSASGAGIGLPICQQIMHLHGGHLVLVEGEGEDIVEFNLELASGAPSHDTQALDVEQAQRYARDMAALRQRMRAPKPSLAGA